MSGYAEPLTPNGPAV